MRAIETEREILHGHLFCGIGGGAVGFNRGHARVGNARARFVCVGGIDSDAAACRDFERHVGARATRLDLFSLEQYEAFHGKRPPPGWAEATPDDVRRAFGNRRPNVVFLSAPCLPADGLVLTSAGEVEISKLEVGDKVLTHRGRYREVTAVGCHHYVGDMNAFRLNGTVDVQRFTDEHPMWVRRVIRTGPGKKRRLDAARFMPAKDVKAGDRIGFPIEREIAGTADSFLRRLSVNGFYMDQDHADALWFLIGCYIGDGYRRKDRPDSMFCVGAEHGELAALVQTNLQLLGVTTIGVDRSGGSSNVKLRITDRSLHAIFGAFGDGAANKRIPQNLVNLEDRLLNQMMVGYRATDGSSQARRRMPKGNMLQARWKIPSVSLQLLRDLQRMLLRTGTFAAIHKCWPGGPQTIMGRDVQTRERWELNVRMDPVKRTVFEFTGEAVWVRVREATKTPTDEMVWNLSVDEDDTFCVPMMATHNCKGFSGLLSERSSLSPKYQALNGLTLRGVWLTLEAFKDDPVELIVFENVPRISTRGSDLLDRIGALYDAYGYAHANTTHDCGELGDLAQSRKRFLKVARHKEKVPPFLYEPDKHRLRGVGEVLDRLPMPLSGEGGPMHRMPSLQWKTWVRLAFVRAGGDWRSLNDLAVTEEGFLRDYGIVPAGPWHRGALGVLGWDETVGTLTSRSGPTNGRFAVADPRAGDLASSERANYGVGQWERPAATVTSARSPGQGRGAVADPRRPEGRAAFGQYGVRPWDVPSGAVTGQNQPGGGPNSVADPRLGGGPKFNSSFRIVRWNEASPAVTGPGGAGGRAVADPRGFGDATRKHVMRVTGWSEPRGAVTSGHSPSNGGGAVADPRIPKGRATRLGVKQWDEPAGVVAGESHPSNGPFAVADPRPTHGPNAHTSKHRVQEWDAPSGVVTGTDRVGSGALCVADPRCAGYAAGAHRNKLKVTAWDQPAGTVTGGKHVQSGLGSVADGRAADRYGVLRYDEPARAVVGHGSHDNGYNSVADPRNESGSTRFPESPAEVNQLPAPAERLICVIFALDGTWHRPFTTLELAALQGLVDPEERFELDGLSDAAWRERIGNCVPPPSAQAIAGVMGETLLLAWAGETFALSNAPIWVRDVAVALSVKPDEVQS